MEDVNNFSNLEGEYTPRYCLQLEAAYGKGMMSEGEVEEIESMFDQVDLRGKKVLDIGSGLGGVAFFVSEKYGAEVIGLEVNRWMVAESTKRTPDFLKNKVHFILSTSNSSWPLLTGNFDLIYSKGVLTHIESKDVLFQECRRLLKENGELVITDWLSGDDKKWGKNISKLMGMGNLVLYPMSREGYAEIFERNGFKVLSERNDVSSYIQYNRQTIKRLQRLKESGEYSQFFTLEELNAHIQAYEWILEALREGELKVYRFVAQKK